MSAFECIHRVYKADGLRGFYRGMSASYAGISETVIHFVIYENIKRRLLEAKAPQNMDEEEDASKDASDFVGMMLAAATSKTCATTIAYPHGESLLSVLVLLVRISFYVHLFIHPILYFCRGNSHQATRRRLQIPLFFPDSNNCPQRRGLPRPVPGSNYTSGTPDP